MRRNELYYQCYGCWFGQKDCCVCNDCPDCGQDRGAPIDVDGNNRPVYEHECVETVFICRDCGIELIWGEDPEFNEYPRYGGYCADCYDNLNRSSHRRATGGFMFYLIFAAIAILILIFWREDEEEEALPDEYFVNED